MTTLGGGGVVLRAEKHTVSGRVTSVEVISDLQVVVHTPSEVKTIALAQADTQVSLIDIFSLQNSVLLYVLAICGPMIYTASYEMF